MACRRKAQRHVHDVGLHRGKVVAQIHQRRAKIAELRLIHGRDVGELGQRGGGVICDDVGGVAQVDHGAGEVHEVVVGDAQLSGSGHDLVDLGGRGGDLRGHGLAGRCQRTEFRFRCVHCFSHGRERGLEVQRRLDGRGTHGHDGGSDRRGERFSRAGERLTRGGRLLAEVLQRFAHGCPLGLRRLERPVATFNVRLCLFDSGAGIVEFGLGRGEGVGGVLRGFLQRCLLAGELADLGGLLAVFLLDQIEVASGGDGRGVRLPKRRAILLVCSGGTGDLLPELGLSVFRLFQPLGVVALSGIALLQLIAGLPERAFVLSDGILLQGQRALERVQLCGKTRSRLFKVRHARAGQFEGGLRLLDLLLHGADVAGKVVAV